MKFMFQFARILLCCILGEVLHMLLPLPIPASIYGLMILLLFLLTGIYKLEQVKAAGNFLTGLFTLLLTPAATGIIDQMDVLAEIWLPILIALVPVTLIVFGVSGRVTQWMMKRGHKDD